ncbi:hypothetical protein [Deinococcus sedimenti]|uniref:Uncharacterized protein n=1 Tax=Deinococcus sedimenti TaxID=1867090 RepID=A0ABQ2S5N2_9DEIO|nr:hypothetical protein [Deinococcus sedimenti]GGR90643.1 hypothetical protein GCM10008960_17110 [Deinococcus sedimenti]
MSVFPQGFTRRLQRAGVTRVQFAYHWHSDEMQLELEVLGEDGQALTLPPELQGEIREGIYRADLGGYRTYLWDLASGEVVPFGQLTYLTGDSQDGTYQVTFTGDPQETLAAHSTPGPTREQVDAWVTSPDPQVRAAVAGNRSVPDDWVTPLHGELDPSVAWAMRDRPRRTLSLSKQQTEAGNPATLPRTLDTLARSQWAQVRRAVAANPSTPGRTLTDLAGDPEWRVRIAVLNNPSVGEDVRSALLTFFRGAGVNLRRTAARDEPVPPDLLNTYAADPDPTVRAAVMDRADLPAALLDHLKADPHPLVQEARGYRRDKTGEAPFDSSWPPEEQWRVIQTAEEDRWGRNAIWSLAQAPNLLPEVRDVLRTQPGAFAALLKRDDLTDAELMNMLGYGSLPVWALPIRPLAAEFFQKLLPKLGEYEQGELAERPDLPPDVRDTLLNSNNVEVQLNMAQKAPLDEPLAHRLASDPEAWVARALLENPTLPPAVAREVLARLGPDTLNPYIHTKEPLPPDLLGVYAEVATGDVLLNLAANPVTPPLPIIEQLRALGPDALPTLLTDPTTPPGMLARLVGTAHDLLLVHHPNFNADHLRALITQSIRSPRFWNAFGEEERRNSVLIHAMLSSPFMTPDLWDTLVSVPHLDWQQRAMVAARPDLPEFIARRLKDDPVQTVARAVRRDLWPDP